MQWTRLMCSTVGRLALTKLCVGCRSIFEPRLLAYLAPHHPKDKYNDPAHTTKHYNYYLQGLRQNLVRNLGGASGSAAMKAVSSATMSPRLSLQLPKKARSGGASQ